MAMNLFLPRPKRVLLTTPDPLETRAVSLRWRDQGRCGARRCNISRAIYTDPALFAPNRRFRYTAIRARRAEGVNALVSHNISAIGKSSGAGIVWATPICRIGWSAAGITYGSFAVKYFLREGG